MIKMIKLAGATAIAATLLYNGNIYAQSQEEEHSGHKMQMSAMTSEAVPARGIIKEVVTSANKIKIKHEAIQAWKMGAMQMTFSLGPDVDIRTLKAGQTIDFMLMRPSTGKYVITRIMAH